MPAIKPNTTPIDAESDWDAGDALADAPNDAKILRYMHAWQDPDGDPDAKSSYRFPHHAPGADTPAILAAVNDGLARLSQADIPEADREGVERHLRKHREDAGLEKSEGGRESKRGGGSDFDGLLSRFNQAVSGFAASVSSAVESVVSALSKARAVAMPNIYQMVDAKLAQMSQESGVWKALVDVYLDGSEMFAVVAVDGKLYKAGVRLDSGDVILGEFDQVEPEYIPIEGQRHLRVLRQADGRYRWFAFPACTAVLNRSGEIDSRKLFQNFVDKIRSGKAPYPYLTFYHLGEALVLGEADYAAVDGYAYLLSGTFDDNPLSRAIARRLEQDADGWGTSIGYIYEPSRVERYQVAGDISIPVYQDGINVEVSILREEDAASLYTGIYATKGVNYMNPKIIEELRALVGDDPDAAQIVEQLAGRVDDVNRQIEAKNLIRRAADDGESAEAKPAEAEPEHDEKADAIAGLVSKVEQLTDALQAVAERVGALAERTNQIEDRQRAALEEIIADLGRNLTRPRAAYRPTAPEGSATLEDIASSTLQNL